MDIGGTFTDIAAYDEHDNQLFFGKELTTPARLVDGIQNAVDTAGLQFASVTILLHGSTVAINTLLERTGAQTALLVTKGFRDVYEIGRINRPDAYNLFFVKHTPLVDRSWRLEVPERLMADGTVRAELDEGAVVEIAKDLKKRGVESVAVLLLHSYRNPDHEKRVKELLCSVLPGVFVTVSHELTREYREFERASTVAANAYIGPRVQTYLDELDQHLTDSGFGGEIYAVQSTGGLFPVSEAREQCVRMLESGPAAGVIGTGALCHQLNLPNAIAFDMGGTTAKAGVICDYEPLTTGQALIGSYDRALPIQIPMIDIFEVGTGGGSIARVAEGGALRVGPQSAGSSPGPACYGRSGEHPTVTDANLLLGRLDADHFLGGQMKLDIDAAGRAMRLVSDPLGLSTTEAAEGILRIAATAMSHAVKGVTTERGLDAGLHAMVVYGGAGPLHASLIAREIGIRRVLIPFSPGHFSAFGMLFSDLRYDYVQSCFQRLHLADFVQLEQQYLAMERRGRAAIETSAIRPLAILVKRYADMRYVGQEHSVSVEIPVDLFHTADRNAIKRRFDAVHQQRYGTCAPNESTDLVSLRCTVVGVMSKPAHRRPSTRSPRPDSSILVRSKNVYFHNSGWINTRVYPRLNLAPGTSVAGPALIEEHASTTVLLPGDELTVDAFGNLDIQIGATR